MTAKKPFRIKGKFASRSSKPVELVVPTEHLPQRFVTRLALLGQMKKYGFKNSQIQKLLVAMYEEITSQQNTQDTIASISSTRKDATQMVPVSNIQASSLTPNFETVRSYFLTNTQRHPDYPSYLPSADIAEAIGRGTDFVKNLASKYATGKNRPLPNVSAMRLVVSSGGYFRGVASLVHKSSGLPCFVDPDLKGIAVWYLMEDGKLVWRNYWSPDAVTDMLKIVNIDLPQKLTEFYSYNENKTKAEEHLASPPSNGA